MNDNPDLSSREHAQLLALYRALTRAGRLEDAQALRERQQLVVPEEQEQEQTPAAPPRGGPKPKALPSVIEADPPPGKTMWGWTNPGKPPKRR